MMSGKSECALGEYLTHGFYGHVEKISCVGVNDITLFCLLLYLQVPS